VVFSSPVWYYNGKRVLSAIGCSMVL